MPKSVLSQNPRQFAFGVAIVAVTGLAMFMPEMAELRPGQNRPAEKSSSVATGDAHSGGSAAAPIAMLAAAEFDPSAQPSNGVMDPVVAPEGSVMAELIAEAPAASVQAPTAPDEAVIAENSSPPANGVTLVAEDFPHVPAFFPEWAFTTESKLLTKTPLAWGAKVSPEFRDKVRAMCGRLGCEPDHMMAAMAFESVETFSPAVKNPLSGATGLIQFMSHTALQLGTTNDELAEMTPEEQLVYVEKYFQPFRGRLTTLADVYMAILWPSAVGQPEDVVLFAEGSVQYRQNSGLDNDGDGSITKAETASLVAAKLEKGRRKQNLG